MYQPQHIMNQMWDNLDLVRVPTDILEESLAGANGPDSIKLSNKWVR
jgi:hypothetical protein